MQVVLVRLQRFCYSLLLKCALQPKIAKKFTENPNFGSLRSFKVINVAKSEMLVTSAYYDEQHVCTYLQPFSHYTSH